MTGSNYPPGMSKRDFIRAGIDDHPNAHTHEWLPDTRPEMFEDWAMHFHERCDRRGCGETRVRRADLTHVTRRREDTDAPPITYCFGPEPFTEIFSEAMWRVEDRPHEILYLDVDPPDYAHLQHGPYTLTFQR
jgi:hypothetical protein